MQRGQYNARLRRAVSFAMSSALCSSTRHQATNGPSQGTGTEVDDGERLSQHFSAKPASQIGSTGLPFEPRDAMHPTPTQRQRWDQSGAGGEWQDTTGADGSGGGSTPGEGDLGSETWEQHSSRMRTSRRRRIVRTTSDVLFEFKFLKKMCQRRPKVRQWILRDDACRMDPGVVEMSPSMQASYMRVYGSKPKGHIRTALRDLVPIIEYRQNEAKQDALPKDATDAPIPEGQPDTLNAKKKEMFERQEDFGDYISNSRSIDRVAHAKLRWKIRLKLIKFQKKLAIHNAATSRSVLYSEADAIAYALYRGPAVYAATHRCLYEISKRMPWFVPKTMLDFGSGTGSSIMAAKEVYDPGSLAYPVRKSSRRTYNHNVSGAAWSLRELKKDLGQLQKTNANKKRARFLAVAALIQNGAIKMEDIPKDLRKEIADVARRAADKADERKRESTRAKMRDVVQNTEWDEDGMPRQTAEEADAHEAEFTEQTGVSPDDPYTPTDDGTGAPAGEKPKKTWWERYVDEEVHKTTAAVQRRLKPLQSIVAIEPSPGMVETAMSVLQEDCPDITWQRYLTEETAVSSGIEQHDLVLSSFTLSEIASPEERRRTIDQLWKNTKSVLVLCEHASPYTFDILMEARDQILGQKGVGLWDWQPTVIGPCPHDKKCPLRHAAIGVKRSRMRVCKTSVKYRSTFIENWVKQSKSGSHEQEDFCYLILARNEVVPDRVEKRTEDLMKQKMEEDSRREQEQAKLHQESLGVKDTVFERLSEEALVRPSEVSLEENRPQAALVEAKDFLEKKRLEDGQVSLVPTPSGAVNRFAFPKVIPPATHKYNRQTFIDQAHQLQRPISPTEMMVVRSEANDIRQEITKRANRNYWRIVAGDPRCKGRVEANFCTHEGELVKARVYRRYYPPGARTSHGRWKSGSKNPAGDLGKAGKLKVMEELEDAMSQGGEVQPSQSVLWQFIGGWRYLRGAKEGWLFPSDVPTYSVRAYPQVSFPNTLVNKNKLSAAARMAMRHDAQLGDTPLPQTSEERLMAEELAKVTEVTPKQRDKMASEKLLSEKFDSMVAQYTKRPEKKDVTQEQMSKIFDSSSTLSTKHWAKAVKNAKHKMRHGK